MHATNHRSAESTVTSRDRTDGRYEDLFVQHRTKIFRLACMLVGDAHVAEEITAEVFARVLPTYRRGAVIEPLPYLRRAVINEIHSRRRRWKHEQRALGRSAGDATGAATPTDRLALREPIVAALATLPPRQRAVVVLRYLDDLSEAEVARIVRCTPGTVKSHASRGLAALRTILEESP